MDVRIKPAHHLASGATLYIFCLRAVARCLASGSGRLPALPDEFHSQANFRKHPQDASGVKTVVMI
jgi:hypothetical protein